MLRQLSICFIALLATGAFCAAPAQADPGMTWTQERAWLASSPFVVFDTITKAYDSTLQSNTGIATIKGGVRRWQLHAILTTKDVVSEETYTFAKGGSVTSLQSGNRASQVLIKRMYGGEAIANEYANARQVASVQIYGDPGKEQFFAARGGKFGFMLDPYEVTIFRASELQERIKEAKYCSTHKECGE